MSRVPTGVAAGHPATADAGARVLEEGGSAADAAVAMTLASCVAETVMTGLAGGGFAAHYEAASGRVELLDFFVTVPGLGESGEGELVDLPIRFGRQEVQYQVGSGSVAVPGTPAGCAALSERHGRLPWPELIRPALELARSGVPLPRVHATCLEMIAPAMTRGYGGRIYAPDDRLLAPGERLYQPGLAQALELLRDEGGATWYRGSTAQTLLDLMSERGGLITRADLEAYEVRISAPLPHSFNGYALHAREDMAHALTTFARLSTRSASAPELALRFARTLGGPDGHGDTTNLVAVDAAGDACVVTHTQGLGAGEWLPGLDVHLNSMLGEDELLGEEPQPGERMASMMVPTIVTDDQGLALAGGAAGGSRIRSALIQSCHGVLLEGQDATTAVERPRLHPVGELVHLEPGFSDEVVETLRAAGYETVLWDETHHYFGGVSMVGRAGAAGDPRRAGAARLV
ncbi:MAG: gamma-glutamyltransferase [Egibacteraceae bacterium]